MKKRILSIILSIVMLVGLLPTTALAVATTADPVKTWNIGAPESGYTATDAWSQPSMMVSAVDLGFFQ